jgi:hypothetical protein
MHDSSMRHMDYQKSCDNARNNGKVWYIYGINVEKITTISFNDFWR